MYDVLCCAVDSLCTHSSHRLSWWKHCADYFPTQLIKTADLDPDGRYIFVVAPHGQSVGWCALRAWCIAADMLQQPSTTSYSLAAQAIDAADSLAEC